MNTSKLGLKWLSQYDSKLLCLKCNGTGCDKCNGTGKSFRIESRTSSIRRYQEENGHARCFGRVFKEIKNLTPINCGESNCEFLNQCLGLHQPKFHVDRIREDSIEFLSRLFFYARAIEQKSTNWTPFQTLTANLISEWSDDTPQVAVIGAFSSGKSHLLNQLIGKPILPVSRTPTTAVITSIKYDDFSHATLEFKDSTKIAFSKDARSLDNISIDVLQRWLTEPKNYNIDSIREIDSMGESHYVDNASLLNEIKKIFSPWEHSDLSLVEKNNRKHIFKKKIRKRKEIDISNLIRTYEVNFKKPNNFEFNLENDEEISKFGEYITNPSLAMCVKKATCYFPQRLLSSFNLLDTAGLCSPVGFHKDVTWELLLRHPDKILVLLDSRRLDSPTNLEAIQVLKRFILSQDDYRQVTFALTFWDLALNTHMTQDIEPSLDYFNFDLRKKVGNLFATEKRKLLAELLTSEVGILCNKQPTIFTLGLGSNSPKEMFKTLKHLWIHLLNECSGWIGVEMWAKRWNNARVYSDNLKNLLMDRLNEYIERKDENINSTDISFQINNYNAHKEQIKKAIEHSQSSIKDIITSQKNYILIQIGNLNSKKDLTEFIYSGYWNSVNTALNELQKTADNEKKRLMDLYKGFRILQYISIDRKLLGLERSVQEKAKGEISGVIYGLKSIWDFFLSGIIELNEVSRESARKILSNEVQDTFELLSKLAEVWILQSNKILDKVVVEIEEKIKFTSIRKSNLSEYIEKLNKSIDYLKNWEKKVDILSYDINEYSLKLQSAFERINQSIDRSFTASIQTEKECIYFQKNRLKGQLHLSSIPPFKWDYLELNLNERSNIFYPKWGNEKKSKVVFLESSTPLNISLFTPPKDAKKFILNLSSMEGFFISSTTKVK